MKRMGLKPRTPQNNFTMTLLTDSLTMAVFGVDSSGEFICIDCRLVSGLLLLNPCPDHRSEAIQKLLVLC